MSGAFEATEGNPSDTPLEVFGCCPPRASRDPLRRELRRGDGEMMAGGRSRSGGGGGRSRNLFFPHRKSLSHTPRRQMLAIHTARYLLEPCAWHGGPSRGSGHLLPSCTRSPELLSTDAFCLFVSETKRANASIARYSRPVTKNSTHF